MMTYEYTESLGYYPFAQHYFSPYGLHTGLQRKGVVAPIQRLNGKKTKLKVVRCNYMLTPGLRSHDLIVPRYQYAGASTHTNVAPIHHGTESY